MLLPNAREEMKRGGEKITLSLADFQLEKSMLGKKHTAGGATLFELPIPRDG